MVQLRELVFRVRNVIEINFSCFIGLIFQPYKKILIKINSNNDQLFITGRKEYD
jgi:hypothetical protein